MTADLPAMAEGLMVAIADFQAKIFLTEEPLVNQTGFLPLRRGLVFLSLLEEVTNLLFTYGVAAGGYEEKAAAQKQGEHETRSG